MIHIVPYHPDHDEAIRNLCNIPVSGNISIALERNPNYYAGSKVQTFIPEVYTVMDNEEVIGVFNIGYRPMWVQGKKEMIRYMCDLRVTPKFQGGRTFFKMQKFYVEKNKKDPFPAQTVVFKDNLIMQGMIEKRKQKPENFPLPFYHEQGLLVTQMVPTGTKLKVNPDYHVRRAMVSDIVMMQEFMEKEGRNIDFFPIYNLSELHTDYYKDLKVSDFFLAFDKDILVGMTAVWNQLDYKQTKIHSYSKLFATIRPFYNLFALLTGNAQLPPPQSVLRYATLACVLVENRSTKVFQALFSNILKDREYAELVYIMCSLDERDPLAKIFGRIKGKRTTYGYNYLVNYKATDDFPKQPFFYVEGARI